MEINQDFKEFIQLLNKHQVKYIVVGGYDVSLYGYPRYTGDIDFWIKPSRENAQKVVQALIDFGFGSLDISEKDIDHENAVIQLGYPPDRIDLLTSVTGLDFDTCWETKDVIESEGERINYISLHHLRVNKEKSGRDKDLLDLKTLPRR